MTQTCTSTLKIVRSSIFGIKSETSQISWTYSRVYYIVQKEWAYVEMNLINIEELQKTLIIRLLKLKGTVPLLCLSYKYQVFNRVWNFWSWMCSVQRINSQVVPIISRLVLLGHLVLFQALIIFSSFPFDESLDLRFLEVNLEVLGFGCLELKLVLSIYDFGPYTRSNYNIERSWDLSQCLQKRLKL